ncbi:MAG: tetratricopeptide repeat protein [Chloroflexi bacterium]|nr:tetratricopeptide repeat protein [Chloroflexota bacterium]
MSKERPHRRRRSLAGLTAALRQASSRSEQAQAHYELGLFHDNNGREAQAIPHYREALALEIDPAVVPEALAWLASSLYKTGHAVEAHKLALKALCLASDPNLQIFLNRLLRRIRRAIAELDSR